MGNVFSFFQEGLQPGGCSFNAADLGVFGNLKEAFGKAGETRCAECPLLQMVGREALRACIVYGIAYHESIHGLEACTNGGEAAAMEMIARASEMSSVPIPDEAVLRQVFRAQQAGLLDATGELAEETVEELEAFMRGCYGTLKMQAGRGGTVFRATVCTSPHAVEASGGMPYPAEVTARPVSLNN